MGPWYILMDEFLVSGETMIRDLQLGLDRSAAFGGAMQVGYLPDMFGHIAQMPQLLAQFGFEHAVVWRGVPAHMQTTAFWWRAPDGSIVRTQYLPDGYSNGATLPDDGKELVAQIERFEQTYGSLAGGAADGPLLWMNGTDHQMPRPWLGRGRGRGERRVRALLDPRRFAGRVSRLRVDRRPRPGRRRAALGRPRQPAHGRGLEPGRRAPGLRGGRARARAPGRAAQCALARSGALARRPARRSLARRHPQRGPRLGVRLLGRRGVQRRAAPLRRSPPDRRGPHRARRGRPRSIGGRHAPRRREPVGPPSQRPGRGLGARRGTHPRHPAAADLPRRPGPRRPDARAGGGGHARPAPRRRGRGRRRRRARRHRRPRAAAVTRSAARRASLDRSGACRP